MEKKSTLISAILDFDLEHRGAKYLTKSVCSVAAFAPLSLYFIKRIYHNVPPRFLGKSFYTVAASREPLC